MLRVQLFERSTPKQLAIFPNGPKRNLRLAQSLDRQRMHTFRRRKSPHTRQMFFQQLPDLGTAWIVDLDLHAGFYRRVAGTSNPPVRRQAFALKKTRIRSSSASIPMSAIRLSGSEENRVQRAKSARFPGIRAHRPRDK